MTQQDNAPADQPHRVHFLSDRAVAARYQVTRQAIWRWARAGTFPEPIRLTPGCTRWRLADIEAWESER